VVAFVPPPPVLVNVTLALLPLFVGVMAPETVKVGKAVAVKLTAVALDPLIVTLWLAGVKLYPDLLGVTV
jgi:hypothetical protein